MIGRSAFAASLSLLLLACGSSCPRETEDTARPFRGGNTNADRTYYETNSWDEPFVDFPAGRRLALMHGLRATPITFTSYLAFKGDALPADGRGFVSESAGNQVLLEGIDEESIRVRNDTCEHFYLRLVASTEPSADGSGGEGGSP